MSNPNLPIATKLNTYIGARYVPKFADTPGSQWDNSIAYEPLVIVLHEGNSFTSKTFVPVGVDINNTIYWAETGNYNAQVEAYRKEVSDISESVNELTAKFPLIAYQNVKWFGVKGDGVTDDTDAIQLALNSNIPLYFPEGTYLISESLMLNNAVILGQNATIKMAGNNLDVYANFQVINNCLIENFNIVGDRNSHTVTTGEYGMGININGSNNVIKDCNISDLWGDGIYIKGDNNSVFNCRIYNARRNGISVINGKNILIDGCHIHKTNGTSPMCAIDIEPNTNEQTVQCTISNCILVDNKRGGIQIDFRHSNQVFNVTMNNIKTFNTGKDNDVPYGDLSIFTNVTTQEGQISVNGWVSENCSIPIINLLHNANVMYSFKGFFVDNASGNVLLNFLTDAKRNGRFRIFMEITQGTYGAVVNNQIDNWIGEIFRFSKSIPFQATTSILPAFNVEYNYVTGDPSIQLIKYPIPTAQPSS